MTEDPEKTMNDPPVTPTETTTAPAMSDRRVLAELAGMSHPGNVRELNEDSFLVARVTRSLELLATSVPEDDLPERTDDAGYLLVVADGMGGAAAGEVASRLAIRTVMRTVLDLPGWSGKLGEEAAEDLLRHTADCFHRVDDVLGQHSRDNPELDGMGTTMTMILSLGSDAFVSHAGDSRAYLMRRGRLQQITRDHTHVQRLVDSGKITREEAATHALRHVLTNVLGGVDRAVDVDVERFSLADGDRLLLCSDGLSEVVRDNDIADHLARDADPAEVCRGLIDLALERGAPDNVTVLVARLAIQDVAPPGETGL